MYDMVTEMQSFVGVTTNDLKVAKESKVTSKNNKEFALEIKRWENGVYDEMPSYFLDRIIAIAKK
jgi:hypothetical protein